MLINEGSGLRAEESPNRITLLSSKKIEDLHDGHCTSFDHLK